MEKKGCIRLGEYLNNTYRKKPITENLIHGPLTKDVFLPEPCK